jgi:hypothetical protein
MKIVILCFIVYQDNKLAESDLIMMYDLMLLVIDQDTNNEIISNLYVVNLY